MLPGDVSIVHMLRVLIADDDRTARALTMHLLKESSGRFEVVAAVASAADAVEVAARDRIDLAVIDYDMPGGGPAAARAIRRFAPAAKIVAVSGHESAQIEMRDAGVDAFFAKGTEIEALIACFDDYSRQHSRI